MNTTSINRDWICSRLESDHPQTVRQVFYQAVAHGLIEGNESGYEAVLRLLRDTRPPAGRITEPSC
jgi:hypothetical protein